MKALPKPIDPNVLVGIEHSDDAAVYRLTDDMAIVATVDFFTPIVDDPYYFGAIAAANALSDVWAMGARPLFALNLVAFPDKELPLSVLTEVLRGGSEKAREAGISVLGGHTVKDKEPKYGMAVIGIVHPQRILTNDRAQPGDHLVLTKPIGTGIISTAIKQGECPPEAEAAAIAAMATINKTAAEVMLNIGVSAVTDVTGFGLLGHLREMVQGGNVGASIAASYVPLLPAVEALAEQGAVPGGTRANMRSTHSAVEYDTTLTDTMRLILNDAQTSGGLLIAVPAEKSARLVEDMRAAGVTAAAVIGEILPEPKGKIFVRF